MRCQTMQCASKFKNKISKNNTSIHLGPSKPQSPRSFAPAFIAGDSEGVLTTVAPKSSLQTLSEKRLR